VGTCCCWYTYTTLQKNKNGFPANPGSEVIYLYTYGRQKAVVGRAIHVLLMVGKRQLWLTIDEDKVQIDEEIVHGRV
jgi:hypothetical protein